MRKEYYVTRTISLHQSNGVVHIEAEVDDWDDGNNNIILLEWDASSLLDDIPSLFDFAMRAELEKNKDREKRYKELKEKL